MLRRVLATLLLAVPTTVLCVLPGCGDEPLPQDMCNWLRDTNNCYARFTNDVTTMCGYDFVAGNDPVASATGYFAARDDLSICIKDDPARPNIAGQIVFDPALDLTTFPLESVGFIALDWQQNECGSFMMTNEQTYTVTINEVLQAEATEAQTPDGNPLDDDIVGGTFTSTHDPGRDRLDVACPGGTENHNFNTLLLTKCPEVQNFQPRAIVESSPGLPETSANPATPGYVRFRVEYPPVDTSDPNAPKRVVEYFNCLIPPPPPPCQDGVKNNTESDIDCGGSCPAKCAEGQSCISNDDCTSGNCSLNGGFRQCGA